MALATVVDFPRLAFPAIARFCALLMANGLKETSLFTGGGEEQGLDL